MSSPRIVVTGAKDGKSVVVSDGEATTIDIPLMPGSAYVPVWGTDETPAVPSSAQATQPRTYFPPAGGFRFCFFTLGPASVALPDNFDAAAAAAQVQHGTRHAWRNKSAEPCVLVVAVTGASRA